MDENYIASNLVKMTEREFELISTLIYKNYGINLTEKKMVLAQGRLQKLIKTYGYSGFREYYDAVINDKSGRMLLEMVDKISTNHTYFYRESEHFDFLREKALPTLVDTQDFSKTNVLRIWCAGCATGEEAYTLAMVIHDHIQANFLDLQLKILATDISISSLETAALGAYSADRVKLLPPQYKHKYMQKRKDGLYEIKPILKEKILFKKFNFMEDAYPFRNKFQVIFLRNVMIYFNIESRKRILDRMHGVLQKEGYLFLGHSETMGRDPRFRTLQPAVYRKL